eukprot:CAMPEP_0171071724 /NCGR_PEP_ID=MMETSP0766_2-20121228/10474_1 /TAXON_ID=439317 /ORGANISM="Gambierdiscus australes, Strain CAWD 149" /LENGTH=67 /DNA_ID=CAMNT_0011528275 /DNA_START=509 /DNA_END=712 /DNA_ORIENTATION=-
MGDADLQSHQRDLRSGPNRHASPEYGLANLSRALAGPEPSWDLAGQTQPPPARSAPPSLSRAQTRLI